MTLQDWLTHCEALHPIAIDLTLERVREVAHRMGLRLEGPPLALPAARELISSAVNTGIGGRQISLSGSTAQAAADLVNRRPQLMEWAIGKGYDRYLEGTGKMIMPGEKISWDQHIHAAGEEVTSSSEIGLWLYPKGQEPTKRSYLVGFTGLKNGTAGLDIPPNSLS